MTEQVDQQICIKFCVKLEYSSVETILMNQKAAAMGNWWLAAYLDNVPAHASRLLQSFLAKHQITQVTQLPYSPDLASCNFWLLPKLKSPLKWVVYQTVYEIQEDMIEQLMVTGRTAWDPEVPTLKGTEASLSHVQCGLYVVFFSRNVYFS